MKILNEWNLGLAALLAPVLLWAAHGGNIQYHSAPTPSGQDIFQCSLNLKPNSHGESQRMAITLSVFNGQGNIFTSADSQPTASFFAHVITEARAKQIRSPRRFVGSGIKVQVQSDGRHQTRLSSSHMLTLDLNDRSQPKFILNDGKVAREIPCGQLLPGSMEEREMTPTLGIRG